MVLKHIKSQKKKNAKKFSETILNKHEQKSYSYPQITKQL